MLKNKHCYNGKPSAYYFYVKANILVDFHCISVPLKRESSTGDFLWILLNFYEHLFCRTSANSWYVQRNRSGVFIINHEHVKSVSGRFAPRLLTQYACLLGNNFLNWVIKPLQNEPRHLFNWFLPSVAFHMETSHLICNANQMTCFYIECNTVLKWLK